MSVGFAGEIVRSPFSGQRLYRTPLLQDDNNQGSVGETVGAGSLFGIVINTTLHSQITESIDTYIADLESDGWQVVLYAAEGGTNNKSKSAQWTSEDFISELEAANQLRDLLKDEHNHGMVGCILIGELPAGWVEAETGSGTGNPVDLFFRDMDSEWDDTDDNGLLDENLTTEGDCKPEIWMSRLYANSLDGDEVSLMKNYFRKNHAYRIGELTLPKRALDYVDDEWVYGGFNVRGLYDEIIQMNDNQITTASDYLARLSEEHSLIRISVHGFGFGHGFFKDSTQTNVFCWDINDNDPCCLFYDVFSCGTFKWWNTNYVDGWYVFSPSYGLASWGECWPGNAGIFYHALSQGKCLGGAQLEYLSEWITEMSYLGGDFGDFGMFGDPTLAPGRIRELTLIYIDADAVGDNNGKNWENAYNSLQDALSAASWGTEIHVAQDIYMPDKGAGVSIGDRAAMFQLKNGVVIKGGYAGFGQSDPNMRDVHKYKTVLSGDIGLSEVNSDNTYHVVVAVSSIGSSAVLDGFTITSGNASGDNYCGGGIYNEGGWPTVSNCIFTANTASGQGGGIHNGRWSNPTVIDCRFVRNSAHEGGGISIRYGSATVKNCVFEMNSARYGGGILNYASAAMFLNCLFFDNQATWGGAMNNQWSQPVLCNCTFAMNSATSGGSLWNHASDSLLINSILWGDTPQEISHNDADSITEVSYSDIQTSDGLPWPGEGNICIDPLFANQSSSDYHLRSQAGRWVGNRQSWAYDGETSQCIDAGDPINPVHDEPFPNGDRINMGAYGGTAEASKSP